MEQKIYHKKHVGLISFLKIPMKGKELVPGTTFYGNKMGL